MKLFTSFFVLGICAISATGMPNVLTLSNLHKINNACMKETNLTLPKPPKKFTVNDMASSKNYPAADAKYACLNKCVAEKIGILSDKHEFNASVLPIEMQSVATKCNDISKSLPGCNRAHNLTVCVVRDIAESIKNITLECANETNTKLDMTKSYKPMQFLKERKYYCLNRCVLIKMNKIDENNNINEEVIKSYAPDNADVPAIIEDCVIDNSQDNQCKKAVKRELCIMKKMKKLYKEDNQDLF